jgi:hypothetical protein
VWGNHWRAMGPRTHPWRKCLRSSRERRPCDWCGGGRFGPRQQVVCGAPNVVPGQKERCDRARC